MMRRDHAHYAAIAYTAALAIGDGREPGERFVMLDERDTLWCEFRRNYAYNLNAWRTAARQR